MKIDDPSKKEQTRIQRRKVVKHFVELLTWLKRLWILYKCIDPLESLLEWLTEGDGSGPLDNYRSGGTLSENTDSLFARAIPAI